MLKLKRIDAADIEHVGAMVSGGLLAALGATKKGAVGWAFRGAGLALLARGAKGYRPLYDRLGIDVSDRPSGLGWYQEKAHYSVDIRRPADELYAVFRNFENLPIFMDFLIEVEEIDDEKSHWVAKAPGGTLVQWNARITTDIVGKRIAWESLEGSGVDSSGSVTFRPSSPGHTTMTVNLRYDPPADLIGAAIAKWFGSDAQSLIERGLNRFKAIMEAVPHERVKPVSAPRNKRTPARSTR